MFPKILQGIKVAFKEDFIRRDIYTAFKAVNLAVVCGEFFGWAGIEVFYK